MREKPTNPHAIEMSLTRIALLQTEKSSLVQKINSMLPYEDNEELVSAYCRIFQVMDDVLLEEARYLAYLEESTRKHATRG